MINCFWNGLKQNPPNLKTIFSIYNGQYALQTLLWKIKDIYKYKYANLSRWGICLSQQLISIIKERVSYMRWCIFIFKTIESPVFCALHFLQMVSWNHKSKSWFQVLLEPVMALRQCNFHFIPCQEV